VAVIACVPAVAKEVIKVTRPLLFIGTLVASTVLPISKRYHTILYKAKRTVGKSCKVTSSPGAVEEGLLSDSTKLTGFTR